MPRLRNFALVAGVAALTIYAMVVGQAILLPLVVSVAVWYLINVLAHSLRRVPLLRLPRRLCLAFAVILFLGLAWMVGDMVASNLGAIATALPAYEPRLDAVVRSVMTAHRCDSDVVRRLEQKLLQHAPDLMKRY